MEIAEILTRRGGVARRADLVEVAGRAAVDHALRVGQVVVDGRGRYALAEADVAVRVASGLTGTLCLTSAALWHGWEVKTTPDRPHVLVPKNRKVGERHRRVAHLHRGDAGPDAGIATDVWTTLAMCLRSLPFDEALAVADSFLRHGGYRGVLKGIAASARGPGSVQVRRVAAAADRAAANPFESALRAIALDVTGLSVQAQRVISSPVVWAQPDLVDPDLRIVLEADSFEWHGRRAALHRDCVRYNRMVADGWRVLRFSWESVMTTPDEVRRILELVVAGRTQPGLWVNRAA